MNAAMVVMLIVTAVAALVEIALVRWLASAASQWIMPLTLHLALSGSLLILGKFAKPFREDKMWPYLAGLTIVVAGPIGAIGTMLAIVLTVFHRRKESSFEDWYEALFPEAMVDSDAGLMARIRSNEKGEGQGVAAFADILAFGTVAQKRELITLITKHFEPRFAGALKMALDDSNNATRVQAASAVAKIQDDVMSRSQALKKAAANGDSKSLLALARHHDEHGKTGLLDPEGSDASRITALDAYRGYLQKEPEDPGACAAVGRLLLQSGKFEETCAWLKQTIDRGNASSEATIAYMEALFRLRRFDELRVVARKYLKKSDSWITEDESVESLKLWAKGYAAS
jgi:tetratricopeptide (TPR) repeat protein